VEDEVRRQMDELPVQVTRVRELDTPQGVQRQQMTMNVKLGCVRDQVQEMRIL